MADKYTKTLELVTTVDSSAYQKFKTEFTKMSTSMSLLRDTKISKQMSDNYAKAQIKLEKIRSLEKAISELELYGGKGSKKAINEMKSQLKQLQLKPLSQQISDAFSSDGIIGKKIISTFSKAGEKVSKFISDSFDSAIEELKTMASYNLGTTLFQNKDALSTSLQYGLSGGQSYALNKALSFFGASSIEDTMYWNDNQKDKFAEKIAKYVDKWNSLNNSGFFEAWDQFQYDFKSFKEDIMYDIMKFIMQNKDTIYTGFQVLTALMKTIVNVLGYIGSLLGFERTQSQIDAKTRDIIANSINTSNSANVTVNNTFNGVQASNKQELVNAGELTMTQIKQVIYGY